MLEVKLAQVPRETSFFLLSGGGTSDQLAIEEDVKAILQAERNDPHQQQLAQLLQHLRNRLLQHRMPYLSADLRQWSKHKLPLVHRRMRQRQLRRRHHAISIQQQV